MAINYSFFALSIYLLHKQLSSLNTEKLKETKIRRFGFRIKNLTFSCEDYEGIVDTWVNRLSYLLKSKKNSSSFFVGLIF
jgi:hypothetical protein